MSRSSSTLYRPTTKYKRRRHPTPMTKQQVKQGISGGTIPSAISDTGATSTAGALHDPFHSTTKPSTKVFLLPTGGTAQATHISQLMLNVRAPANQVDIVPTLTQTLLSGSKFADAGYTAVYDKDEVNFYDSNKIHVNATSILQGYRCPHAGLWRVPLRQITRNINNDTLILDSPCGTKSLNTKYVVPSTEEIRALLASSSTREQHSILNVYELPSIQQTIRYLHAAAGFPAKTTWMAAIRHGNYNTWPLVTVANVHKHFPQSEETQQGHMRSQRQGVRSTKTTRHAPPTIPAHTAPLSLTITYLSRPRHPGHSLLRSNRYQMILYHTDSNSIWVEPTKNRTEGELILARTRALSRMRACGLSPKRQVLDNEASAAYKQAILDSGMTYQLVPPDDHRRNVAEKAIQTWKDHFVAVISGTADKFPLHLWCQLIPHMERQLNLLRQSNANPKISAYAHLYGPHDYNAAPFVPLGMEALVHDKPHRRKTYAQHCSRGWIIGTSTEHYRCWKIWSPTTLTPHSNRPAPATASAPAVIHAPPPRVQTQTPIPTAWPRPSTSHVISDDEDSDDKTAPPPRVPTRRPVPSPPYQQPATTPPALNTRSRTRSITQETMLHFLATHHVGITAAKATQRRYPPDMLHAVLNDETGELMEYRHLIANPKYRDTWQNAYGKELGRLAQGLPGIVKGTDTIAFIQRSHVSQDRWKDVTYGRIVANFRPEKEDPYRIRLTVGGNRINYPGDCGTPTADMITVKILLNSVISTLNAKFMTIDIKDFYLNTPMARPEYMRLKLSDIPAAIIDLYKLRDIAQDGYVFVRIQKVCMDSHRRHHCTATPRTTPPGQRLPPKQTQPVKYEGKVHAEHLINTLTGHYDISTDWDGWRYIGLTLQWDYRNRTVRLSMPGYCEKPDNVSVTLCLPNHNTNLIPALRAPTAADNNYVPLLTLHQHWESNKDLRTRSHWSFPLLCSGS
eukprot:CCRYP_007336-RA/>CCRYP_007336-RA protein AED:0.15 eAED:0.19 QI:0/0/0/1/0.33/0.25/4/0/962